MTKAHLKYCWQQFLRLGFDAPTGQLLTLSRHFVRVCRRQGDNEDEVVERLMEALDWDDVSDARFLVSCIREDGTFHLRNSLRFWLEYPRGHSRFTFYEAGDPLSNGVLAADIRSACLRGSRNNLAAFGTPVIGNVFDGVLHLVCGDSRLELHFAQGCPFPDGEVVGNPLRFRETGNALAHLLERHWALWPPLVKAELAGFV